MRTFTRTVSPGWKAGILRPPRARLASSASRSLMIVIVSISYWASAALCLLLGEVGRPEVRTPLPRGRLPRRPPPGGHLLVVAGEEDIRDLAPLERPRSGELRMLQEPVFKTLLGQALRLAQHPGQQADHGLDHHQRRRLTAGEHRVAHGDLLEPARVDHPLVHPLEPAAEQDEARA